MALAHQPYLRTPHHLPRLGRLGQLKSGSRLTHSAHFETSEAAILHTIRERGQEGDDDD
jgi:hypothetical protein